MFTVTQASAKKVKEYFYIDPQSDPFLDQSQLDSVNSLRKSGFRFHNPNSKSSCGCGQSSSV